MEIETRGGSTSGYSRTGSRNALLVVPDIVPVDVYRFEVRNDAEGNFSIVATSPFDRSGGTLQPGEATQVQIIFDPRRMAPDTAFENKTATLVAVTDLGDLEMEISGAAMAPPEPNPQPIPRLITFGIVGEGSTDTRTLRLHNHGAGELRVNGVMATGDPGFAANPASGVLPRRIGRASALDVDVDFTASGASGMRYGTLVFDTNAGPVTVDVSAYVSAP